MLRSRIGSKIWLVLSLRLDWDSQLKTFFLRGDFYHLTSVPFAFDNNNNNNNSSGNNISTMSYLVINWRGLSIVSSSSSDIAQAEVFLRRKKRLQRCFGLTSITGISPKQTDLIAAWRCWRCFFHHLFIITFTFFSLFYWLPAAFTCCTEAQEWRRRWRRQRH